MSKKAKIRIAPAGAKAASKAHDEPPAAVHRFELPEGHPALQPIDEALETPAQDPAAKIDAGA